MVHDASVALGASDLSASRGDVAGRRRVGHSYRQLAADLGQGHGPTIYLRSPVYCFSGWQPRREVGEHQSIGTRDGGDPTSVLRRAVVCVLARRFLPSAALADEQVRIARKLGQRIARAAIARVGQDTAAMLGSNVGVDPATGARLAIGAARKTTAFPVACAGEQPAGGVTIRGRHPRETRSPVRLPARVRPAPR